ncbi:hypothetical protein M426DRAFT_67687 [Hypoxylon sp. CI-4A]|nr:hypothetical protein M426DRAFT_67687 [Hypoxylon sp. CI-4A]
METGGRSIPPLKSLILDLPPSCIEFCPGYPDYFVVGTYNLQKEDNQAAVGDDEEQQQQQTGKSAQTRNGSLVLFRLLDDMDIKLVQTALYPSAILDLHFHPTREERNVLAVVSSTGTLSFFRLSASEESSVSLVEIATHKPLGNDDGILFLSCSWHPHIPELLAITTSDFQVHILRITDSWDAYTTRSEPVITHSLEAWTVAFSSLLPRSLDSDENNPPEENSQQFTMFSGGDDSKLFATSCIFNQAQKSQVYGEDDLIDAPYTTIAFRGHEAGVTAILPLNLQILSTASVIITGSYDDHIRVYIVDEQETGIPQRPRLLAEQNLDGGVWRLKLIKLEKRGGSSSVSDQVVEGKADEQQQWSALILASCMHAGSRVLEITGNTATDTVGIRILGRFEEHKSMNYGSDFQPGSEQEGRNLRCVSTSFYDRLLCLWEY